jgi:hypothetical protein
MRLLNGKRGVSPSQVWKSVLQSATKECARVVDARHSDLAITIKIRCNYNLGTTFENKNENSQVTHPPQNQKYQYPPGKNNPHNSKKPCQTRRLTSWDRNIHPPQPRDNVHRHNDDRKQGQLAKKRINAIVGLHRIDGEIGEIISVRSRENLFEGRQIRSHCDNVI